MTMRIPSVCSALLVATLAPGVAHADAADLKRTADEAYDSHRYDAAARAYEASYAEKKEPSVLYNLARTYEALGRHPEALDRLQRFSDTAPFETRRRVPKLDGLLEVYRTRVATLDVRSNVSGARIIVRNVIVGETTTQPMKVAVNAGSATIEVSKAGYSPWTRTLTLEGAAVTLVDAKLEEKSATTTAAAPVTYVPESPPPSTPLYKNVWLWAGVGAVVLVTTTVILFVAFNTERAPDRGTLGPGTTVVTRSLPPLVTF